MKTNLPLIIFDDSVKNKVISLIGKINSNLELSDEDGKIITSQDFESIKSTDFGGILMGSKIPIKKDQSELVKYFIYNE